MDSWVLFMLSKLYVRFFFNFYVLWTYFRLIPKEIFLHPESVYYFCDSQLWSNLFLFFSSLKFTEFFFFFGRARVHTCMADKWSTAELWPYCSIHSSFDPCFIAAFPLLLPRNSTTEGILLFWRMEIWIWMLGAYIFNSWVSITRPYQWTEAGNKPCNIHKKYLGHVGHEFYHQVTTQTLCLSIVKYVHSNTHELLFLNLSPYITSFISTFILISDFSIISFSYEGGFWLTLSLFYNTRFMKYFRM